MNATRGLATPHAGCRGLPGPAASAVVAAAFLVTMLGTTMPTPLYLLYEQRFGFGGLMVTVIFATYAVGVGIGLMAFGRISDQVGRRRLLLPGLAVAALSAVVFVVPGSIPGSIPALFVGRLRSGLSAGIFTGTATATLIDFAPPGAQQRYSLAAAAVNMLGLGPSDLVLARSLAESAPWPLELTYAVHLGLVVLAALGPWFVPDTVERGDDPVRWRIQRVTVPPPVRGTFVRAAIAGFGRPAAGADKVTMAGDVRYAARNPLAIWRSWRWRCPTAALRSSGDRWHQPRDDVIAAAAVVGAPPDPRPIHRRRCRRIRRLALFGLPSALVFSLLSEPLHDASHILAGLAVFALFAAAAVRPADGRTPRALMGLLHWTDWRF